MSLVTTKPLPAFELQTEPLTPRWYPLKPHPVQLRMELTKARFIIACAGRRSGKTERAKRRAVRKALTFTKYPDGRFIFSGPTQQQATDIFWEDLKMMVPEYCLQGGRKWGIQESQPKTIRLINGAHLIVAGMDKPQRVEGKPIDGIVLTEFADMKMETWGNHVRPGLSTIGRPGWAIIDSVPEGRNHYFDLCEKAKEDTTGAWEFLHWKSAEVIDPEEIAAAKQDLDPETYEQEYEAAFVARTGRAYYCFNRNDHCVSLRYNPNLPLVICFDFNVEPGVAVYIQEKGSITNVIGEVYIPKNSNTAMVCRKILSDYGKHKQDVFIYGDPSGGARSTKAEQGTDWDIIRSILRPVFGERYRDRVKRQAPLERVRINSVNSRLRTADGEIHMLVDPVKAKNTVSDFENVVIKEGTAGEIDKDDLRLTHLTDAVGYYCEARHPMRSVNRSTGEAI